MSMQIHQATIEDLEQLVPLFDAYRQFYGQPPDEALARAFLLERFQHQESIIFLACEQTGAGLGFTQLYPSFSSVGAKRIYILNDLFVVPAARGRGLAGQLLERAAQFGRAMGALRLTLATGLENKTAQKVYESLGWQRDENFYHYDLP